MKPFPRLAVNVQSIKEIKEVQNIMSQVNVFNIPDWSPSNDFIISKHGVNSYINLDKDKGAYLSYGNNNTYGTPHGAFSEVKKISFPEFIKLAKQKGLKTSIITNKNLRRINWTVKESFQEYFKNNT